MVADKVIHHLQFVKEGFFVERFASEIKPNRVKGFFVLDPGKVRFLRFLSYFLKLASAFTTRPKPFKEANTMGFKVMPPATADVITALPATILQSKFFL